MLKISAKFLIFLSARKIALVMTNIVSVSKTAHFLLNFTLNKIKLAQIMYNRVYFVRNTCYFDVQ